VHEVSNILESFVGLIRDILKGSVNTCELTAKTCPTPAHCALSLCDFLAKNKIAATAQLTRFSAT
jgi:hypothetical protein